MSEEGLDFHVEELVKEFPKSWVVIIDGETYSFPKSKCELGGLTITVPAWIAKDRGLIEDADDKDLR